ncbi:Maestro heat-like repeat family member 5 [Phytophthora palmivora]|uniref:Maestro heat-like repeat family member 5 n=1 Tax=Phytophthora palmivora TaxID=4796 RepID=A0A2P4YEF8_9STRA|nr:Maestro heat-like repeat family member 5 [Phytophthora palmivora]
MSFQRDAYRYESQPGSWSGTDRPLLGLESDGTSPRSNRMKRAMEPTGTLCFQQSCCCLIFTENCAASNSLAASGGSNNRLPELVDGGFRACDGGTAGVNGRATSCNVAAHTKAGGADARSNKDTLSARADNGEVKARADNGGVESRIDNGGEACADNGGLDAPTATGGVCALANSDT